MHRLTRRRMLSALALTAGWAAFPSQGRAAPTLSVTKDPNCGCCGAWVDHMRAAGFTVEVTESSEVNRLKARLGVPRELSSCHTAEIDGYVVEGHVPSAAVTRLLAQRPQARGLSVPGMPIGSPGMEVEGSPAEAYEVVLFGDFGRRPFARFRGSEEF